MSNFKKYGQSGLEISELFARTAEHADSTAIIRSMKAQVPNHEPSLMLMNCGDGVQARPSVGSWVLYGLGSANRNLPGFVALSPGGYPTKGPDNWQAGFLPGSFQGTYIDSKHESLARIIENIEHPQAATATQRRQLDLLAELNAEHRATRADARLDARIEQNFELAFRMQTESRGSLRYQPRNRRDARSLWPHRPRPADPHRPAAPRTRRALRTGLARRFAAVGQSTRISKRITAASAREIDRPLAARCSRRPQRARHVSTTRWSIWGGEFGRTPTVEMTDDGKSRLWAATTTPTASASGSPAEASKAARFMAQPTNSSHSPPQRTPPGRPRPTCDDPASARLLITRS